jgi:hypothetical protein
MTKQPPNPTNAVDLAELNRIGTQENDAGEREFGIRIGRDGTWYYLGSPIARKPLVKLFSTVLRLDENGQYWLVTPVERGRIEVDDAPFTAVEVTWSGSGPDTDLTFRTNIDEEVVAGPEHPIRVVEDPETGEPTPYILIRDNLEALILRPVFYELVELAEERAAADGVVLGVWSRGDFFPLGRPDEA